jgi:hypothetical protein
MLSVTLMMYNGQADCHSPIAEVPSISRVLCLLSLSGGSRALSNSQDCCTSLNLIGCMMLLSMELMERMRLSLHLMQRVIALQFPIEPDRVHDGFSSRCRVCMLVHMHW